MENGMKTFRFGCIVALAALAIALSASSAAAQVVYTDPETEQFTDESPSVGGESEEVSLPSFLQSGPAIGVLTEFAVQGPTGGVGLRAEGGFLHMMVVGPARDANGFDAGCAPVEPSQAGGQCENATARER